MKLEYHKLLSTFAFNSNLRRYPEGVGVKSSDVAIAGESQSIALKVGRCRLMV